MKTSLSRPKINARSIQAITGNRHLSHFDPRVIDEIRHCLNLLLDLHVVIVDDSNPRKNVLMLSDSRATLPLAIPSAAPIPFSYWHAKEVHDEYVLCRSWNGKTEGKTDTKIAKPAELRSSVVTETLPDGTVLTFSAWDAADQSRHVEGDDGTSEDQFITPRYLIADETTNTHSVIRAVRMTTFAKDEDGKDISLMDINNAGRAFASPE